MTPSLDAVLAGLVPDLPAAREHLRAAEDPDPSPWYIRLLIAAAAWIAACFLGVFLGAVVGVLDLPFGPTVTFFGVVAVTVAVLVVQLAGPEAVFLPQLALAMSGGGHVATIVGLMAFFDYPRGPLVPFCAAALCAVLYVPHDRILHRFLSVLAVVVSTTGWLAVEDHSAAALVASAGFAVVALGLASWSSRGPALRPAVLGLALGSTASILGLRFMGGGWLLRGEEIWLQVGAWVGASILAGACLWTLRWLAGGSAPLRRPPWSIAATVCLGLAALGVPGVLLALATLVLGFLRRDDALWWLGALLLPAAVTTGYYNLSVDLYTKSFLLMGSGIALLLARLALPQAAAPEPEGGSA